jgi:hypothetical protein
MGRVPGTPELLKAYLIGWARLMLPDSHASQAKRMFQE